MNSEVRNQTSLFSILWVFLNPAHLQSLTPFLGQSSQCVPLVTDPLASGVYTGGVVVVQLTGAQTHRNKESCYRNALIPIKPTSFGCFCNIISLWCTSGSNWLGLRSCNVFVDPYRVSLCHLQGLCFFFFFLVFHYSLLRMKWTSAQESERVYGWYS